MKRVIHFKCYGFFSITIEKDILDLFMKIVESCFLQILRYLKEDLDIHYYTIFTSEISVFSDNAINSGDVKYTLSKITHTQ